MKGTNIGAAAQAEFSNEMRKVLQSAVKRAKQNNDSFMGVDALLKALLENKDVAAALSEAGRCSSTPFSSSTHLAQISRCPKILAHCFLSSRKQTEHA